jgi:hypothetical protein
MKEASFDLQRVISRLPDKFWGSIEITYQNGVARHARLTENIQLNQPTRDDRGTENASSTRSK